MTTGRSTPGRRVLQSDIAAEAGVSVSTVSRVLNHADGIRDAVREQVWEAAQTLGYEPRPANRDSALRHVGFFTTLATIGSPSDPFHTDILAGVEAECRRQGLRVSVLTLEQGDAPNANVAAARLAQARDRGVDACLLLSIDDRRLIDEILDLGLPSAGINIDDPYLGIDTFVPNNRAGAYFATKYLVDAGCRRIAHVTNPRRATIRKRFEGYRAALHDAGIDFDPALVIESGLGADAAHDAVAAFLQGGTDLDGLFAANDHAAIGALHALREAGKAVPNDVAVLGFDDIPMAAYVTPPLSTMRVQRQELGALAVRRLLEYGPDAHPTPIRVQVATRLVERATARPPAQAPRHVHRQPQR